MSLPLRLTLPPISPDVMNRSRPLRLVRTPGPSSPGTGPDAAVERSLLVKAAQGGDVRAFAALVDTYYARCLRFALHMLSSQGDAEEAVQDTFVRVYRALPTYV